MLGATQSGRAVYFNPADIPKSLGLFPNFEDGVGRGLGADDNGMEEIRQLSHPF